MPGRQTGVITDTVQTPAQLGGPDPGPTPSGRKPGPPRLLCWLAAGRSHAGPRGRLAPSGRATPVNERGDIDVPAAPVQDLCLREPQSSRRPDIYLPGAANAREGTWKQAGQMAASAETAAVAPLSPCTHRLRRRALAAP